MKNNNLKLFKFILVSAILLDGFNLFLSAGPSRGASHSDSGISTLASISEGDRVDHAKELLGKTYTGSNAERTEGKKSLNRLIYKKIHSKLTLPWRQRAQSITNTLISESSRHKLDPVFVLAVIKTESNFKPQLVGRFGEIGLMQIKPETAKWIANKYNIPWKGPKSLRNPENNIKIGTAYIEYLREAFNSKAGKYVNAYNIGPKNVRRLLSQNIKPKEYSSLVLKNYAGLYSSLNRSDMNDSSIKFNQAVATNEGLQFEN